MMAVAAFLFVLDIVVGSVHIPLSNLLSDDEILHEIIFNFRLPKAVTAVIVGAAISVAGLEMQTLFHNPLAGPYVLGISSGSTLGVALFTLGSATLASTLSANLNGWGIIVAATLGACTVLLLMLGVSFRIKQAVSLLLIGTMFGQIAGSVVTILQNHSNPDLLKLFIVWTFGSLSAVSWNYMKVMAPIALLGILLSIAIIKQLNALLLGENYAQGLGVSIKRTRLMIILSVALLAGATTAFTGPIAFVGMAVPHLVKGILKTSNHAATLPGCIICGSALLLLCDVATQMPANGYTLPINAVSSLIGAPIIIWIILKNKS
ncbi:MAG: iron ABC transporter permease [Paludibacteraceae bacterium]|nr:iron ABC transporter permease [Paludibacteraceae bacterium]